ncbi:MAG: TRAP transporter small permease [Pseudomonadota bacterium]
MAQPLSIRVAQHGGNSVLKFIGWLSALSGIVAAFLIVLAVAITCQMIFVRFVLNDSTIWQTEMVVYLMIAATMLGLPYVQLLRGHVNVELLPMMLPMGLRKVLAVVTLSVAIAVIGAMLFYGYSMWHEAWSRGWRSDTVWGVKLWLPYLAIPVGFGLYLLQLIADLAALLFGYEKPFQLDEGGN